MTTKRAPLTGHYYKKVVRGNTYFAWRVSKGYGSDGKTKYKALTAKTQKELEIKIKQYNEEREKLRNLDSKRTFCQYTDLYLTNIRASLKRKTIESYSSYINRYFLKSNFATKELKKITTVELQDFINSYIDSLSPVTICDIRRCLHAIFQRAVEERLILYNPVSNVKAPRIPHKEIKILNSAEIQNLLRTAQEGKYIYTGAKSEYHFVEDDSMIYNRHAFFTALSLLWYTGMRRGECWGLSWTHINLDKATVRICQNYQPAENGNGFFDDPKTKNSIRTITLPQKMVKILYDWRDEQNRFAEMFDGIFVNTMNLVFTNAYGQGVSYATINRYWRKLKKATGLLNLRTHDIRHNHISWLLGQGVPATEVARRVGDTVETILRVYAHAMPTHDEETARLLDEKLNIF